MADKKLYRSRKNRMIAGVASGIGEYLNIDPTVIRLLFLLLLFGGGSGLILYIVLWIIIPEEPGAEDDRRTDRTAHDNRDQSDRNGGTSPAEDNIKKAAAAVEDALSGINRSNSDRLIGVLLLIIGGLFLIGNLMPALLDWGTYWPLVLVFIGLWLLISRQEGGK